MRGDNLLLGFEHVDLTLSMSLRAREGETVSARDCFGGVPQGTVDRLAMTDHKLAKKAGAPVGSRWQISYSPRLESGPNACIQQSFGLATDADYFIWARRRIRRPLRRAALFLCRMPFSAALSRALIASIVDTRASSLPL